MQPSVAGSVAPPYQVIIIFLLSYIEVTMEPKLSKEATLDCENGLKGGTEQVTHKVDFMVDSNFGVPGAIIVSNKYQKEFFLESITIEGVVHFSCNSWVQPEKFNAGKRVFFSNKVKFKILLSNYSIYYLFVFLVFLFINF